MTKRVRDYKAEYARRVQRGMAKGRSRSQSRGHPGVQELLVAPDKQKSIDQHRIEVALREVAHGKTLSASARSAGITPAKLRYFLSQKGIGEKVKGRWKIKDAQAREMLVYSKGAARTILVNNVRGDASLLGKYLAATHLALERNEDHYLKPFKGLSVTDMKGTIYPLETRLEVIYRLHRADPFENVYRYVA